MYLPTLFSETTILLASILSYAEIHYHLKYLYPKYYLKQPEIITDCPIRNIGGKLPVLLIIKDSHLFPIKVELIKFNVKQGDKCISIVKQVGLDLSQEYFSRIFELDLNGFEEEDYIYLKPIVKISINDQIKEIEVDNYSGIDKEPLTVYYTNRKLPFPQKWYLGEPHYHSSYTSDQVEFGADPESSVCLAKSMGLDWLFITDHSYDLDDRVDNYIQNDPELPKWNMLKEEVVRISQKYPQFKTILGEEVSIGNHKSKNVHMLAVNEDTFIEGSGDSAEIWFKNKPQRKITEIPLIQKENNLFIAAHPFEKIPFAQKLTLRRGNWELDDFLESNIKLLQIINTADRNFINYAIKKWVSLLLKGYKFLIIAGNDAHGNFNYMKQISQPFLKLFSNKKQIFGNFFTAFHFNENNPIKALKKGHLICSNGPFLDFSVISDSEYHIHQVVKGNQKVRIKYSTATSKEFGEVSKLNLFIGNINRNIEQQIQIETLADVYLPEKGYLRMSLETEKGGVVFTNPIWFE